MLKALLKWLGPWLLGQLIPVLDPEAAGRAQKLKEDIAAFEIKVKEAEALQQQSEAAYAASVDKRKEFDRLAAESGAAEDASKARLAESQARVRAIDDETAKLNAAVDSRTDDERFGGVPKSGRV